MSGPARPYVDRPVGDVDLADRVAADAAAQLGLARPERLRVGMNALYRCRDTVLRVGRPSAPGALASELALRLLELGVPVAEPVAGAVYEADGLVATGWRRLRATGAAIDWTAVGRIVRHVHGIDPRDLPAGYPLPSPTSFPWWDFEAMLADVAADIDDAALGAIRATVDRHVGWTDMVRSGAVVCHGDVHPGNVMMTDRGPVLLDWDLMCVANPGWDHAMLITLAERWGGDPGVYPAFAAGYGRSSSGDPGASAFAALRNVAATLMRVRAGRADPAARAEAARRLRFWRGEQGAPMWTAQ